MTKKKNGDIDTFYACFSFLFESKLGYSMQRWFVYVHVKRTDRRRLNKQ